MNLLLDRDIFNNQQLIFDQYCHTGLTDPLNKHLMNVFMSFQVVTLLEMEIVSGKKCGFQPNHFADMSVNVAR